MFYLKKLKIFKFKKKNEEVKNESFFYLSCNSHFNHTKILILADLKSINIFLISLLFNETQHLKIVWKQPEIDILGQTCGAGGCFHMKTKITSFQSTSLDIWKDVKGCKETNSRPLHTNKI